MPRASRTATGWRGRTLWLLLASFAVASLVWAQEISEFLSPGELSDHHAELRGVFQCTECHTLGGGISPDLCMDCHERVAEQVRTQRGFHSDKGERCGSCHPDHRGRAASLFELEEEAFDHDATGFSLRGAHEPLACTDCHDEDGTYLGLQSTCMPCHAEDDPHRTLEGRPWSQRCETCHGEVDWETVDRMLAAFDHDDPQQADYPLEGEHRAVDCEDCHTLWDFVPLESEACLDCHEDLHDGQFDPRTCEDCHTVHDRHFELRDYDHDTTAFPLRGRHQDVACEPCHGDGPDGHYVSLPFGRCDNCHDDVHDGAFFPRDCAACHTVEGFGGSGFDHDQTDYPLLGEHQQVACSACHGEGDAVQWNGLRYSDCSSCHADVHEGTFARDACVSCHTQGTWTVRSFRHERTAYPLTGAHRQVPCAACHGEGPDRQLKGLAFGACTDCHDPAHPHRGADATATCTDCHTTEAWPTVRFDHQGATGWPLEGQHAPLACEACHSDPTFGGTERQCASCHQSDRPTPHFEGACSDCHVPTGWRQSTLSVEAHAQTGFALRGAHRTVACHDCHDDPSVGPTCTSCHAADDPHRHLLGEQCESCHTETDWLRVRFDHASTGFFLRGAHRMARCVDCHTTAMVRVPDTCRSCHEADRPRDALHSDPLTFTCESCHRPTTWAASFLLPGADR